MISKAENKAIYLLIAGIVMFSWINIVFADNSIFLHLDSYSINDCPYVTKMISGFVENIGNKAVEVKLFSNSEWITIAQDSLLLSPGEKKEINIFVTPTENAKIGEYSAKIYATTDSDEISKEIIIKILDCHDVSLSLSDNTIKACIGDTLKIPFYIKNNGRSEEHVVLNVDKGKLDFYETVLDAYESDKDYLFYKVKKDYDVITLKSQSKNSFAKDEKKIYVSGENCYDFDMTVIPQATDICMKDKGIFEIYLKNNGDKKDIIHLKTSDGVLSNKTVILQPGEKRKVYLKVIPHKEGEIAIKVEAWDKVKHESRDLQITAKYCSNNAMIIVPQKMSVCKGSAARYIIGIRNLGEIDENLNIESTLGEMDNNIEVKPGNTVYKELFISTKDMKYGNYTFNITLKKNKGKIIDTLKGQLEVKNCYDGEIYTQYKEVEACKFTPSKPIDIVIRNTGERKETYKLSGSLGYFKEDTITLNSGEEKIVPYIINISKDVAEGIIEDTLSIKGEHMIKEKSIKLNVRVLKKNMCSNFSIQIIPESIEASEYKGYLYKIKIKNYGYAPNTFHLTLDEDYGMAYVEPKEININSGEEGTIFLYVVPNEKMPNKVYELKGQVIDKYGNSKPVVAKLNLEVEKSEFTKGSTEDKIIVKVKNFDKEKTYYVSKENTTSLKIKYYMEGKEEEEEILFVGGNFIIQIGDELYEDKNPEIGKKEYVIKANNKTYRITIKFVYVNKEKGEYKFKIESIIIEKEKRRLYPQKGSEKGWWQSWRIIVPIIVLLIGILLIAYDLLKIKKYKEETPKNKERKKEIEDLRKVIEK